MSTHNVEDSLLELMDIQRTRRIEDAEHFMGRLNRGELMDFKDKYPRLSDYLVEELSK